MHLIMILSMSTAILIGRGTASIFGILSICTNLVRTAPNAAAPRLIGHLFGDESMKKVLTQKRNRKHQNMIRREKDEVQPKIKKEVMDTTTEDMNESTAVEDEKPKYSELIKTVNEIARPLAGKKLTKALFKTARKAAEHKSVRRGVKEVTKALRKGEKGLVVLAGDVTPIDVYSHLPVMCEDRHIPYCYVPSRKDLGEAILTKRPTCAVMIKRHDGFISRYDKSFEEVKSLSF